MKAYKQNITGEGYVWLMVGWYREGWYLEENFVKEDLLLSCTRDQMKAAVEGSLYISTETLNFRPDNEKIVSGLVMIFFAFLFFLPFFLSFFFLSSSSSPFFVSMFT